METMDLYGLGVAAAMGATVVALIVQLRRFNAKQRGSHTPLEPGEVPASSGSSVAAPADAALDVPEAPATRLGRLKGRLQGTSMGATLVALLSRDVLDADTWDEIEETLLLADVGAGPTGEILDRLREHLKNSESRDAVTAKKLLQQEILTALQVSQSRDLNLPKHEGRPATVMVVGVNGVGKTTTVGKIARITVAEGKSVVLGAADTFRAAAAEQLATWAQRVGATCVRSDRDGADPASVAFDAVQTGIDENADLVLIDTAGRLQNKVGLMDELGKVKRVAERHGPIDEVLLVLDATTGQNGMIQAKVFSEVVQVTGIVLTKLDGTAKGGIVIAVQKELGVPVKLVGLGEGPDDLAPFDPEVFAEALVS